MAVFIILFFKEGSNLEFAFHKSSEVFDSLILKAFNVYVTLNSLMYKHEL